MKKLYIKLFSLLALAVVWSCDEDSSAGPIPPSGNMVLNVSNLEVLPDGYTYEGWIVVNGTPISTGQFQVDENGEVDDKTIPVESTSLENAEKFVVSIESTTDGDPNPSAIKVLAADFTQYEADLTPIGADAIGTGFDETDFSGKYLINAPTSVTTDDDTSGIWFIDNTGGNAVAGLTLSTLNTGWVYEGWVIIDDVPVSTGRFTSVNGADESCIYCGTLPAPNFPGEDFLQNAPTGLTFPTILSDYRAVISIEPQPDYSDAPSDFKILDGIIPSVNSIVIGTSYDMMNVSVDVPSGKVLRFYGFDCTNDGCL